MRSINVLEAKSSLSKLIAEIEQGKAREIIIARHGKPAAKLVPLDTAPSGKRLGVAKGKLVVPDDIDANNQSMRLLFEGADLP